MERDFMGLTSKQPVAVKEELEDDGFKEIGDSKSSAVQWPSSDKVSAIPNFMSFGGTQDGKSNKVRTDAPVSSIFMPASVAEIQDMKMLPFSNQPASIPVTNTLFRNPFTASAPNLISPSMKPQLLRGIPVSLNSFVGFTESRNNVISSGSPPQLTIFYAGTVNVFDNISPEKAQAIMFLAGNGSLTPPSVIAYPKVQAPCSTPVGGDRTSVNQSINASPSPALSSSVSASSHSGTQSGSGSSSTDKPTTAKPAAVKAGPANVMGSFCAASMIPSGTIPQARKASLARFLEKRKERVMNAMPYNVSKKSLECSTGESSGMNYCATSAA